MLRMLNLMNQNYPGMNKIRRRATMKNVHITTLIANQNMPYFCIKTGDEINILYMPDYSDIISGMNKGLTWSKEQLKEEIPSGIWRVKK